MNAVAAVRSIVVLVIAMMAIIVVWWGMGPASSSSPSSSLLTFDAHSSASGHFTHALARALRGVTPACGSLLARLLQTVPGMVYDCE